MSQNRPGSSPEGPRILENSIFAGRQRGTRWVLTWNNPPEDWFDVIKQHSEELGIVYFVGGQEIAPETGTPHIQGYMRLEKMKWGYQIMRVLNHAWIDIARGSEADNIRYCKKDGKYMELGDPVTGEGRKLCRRDYWNGLLKDLITLSDPEFEAKYPYESVQYWGKLREIKIQKNRRYDIYTGDLKMKNVWIWGPTGTGKSRWAREIIEASKIYPKTPNKWWNGYDPLTHRVVVYEDYDRETKGMTQYIKIWADRYPFLAEIKNSHTWVCPADYCLIITANHCIQDSFPNVSVEDIDAISRRFTQIEMHSQETIIPWTIPEWLVREPGASQ